MRRNKWWIVVLVLAGLYVLWQRAPNSLPESTQPRAQTQQASPTPAPTSRDIRNNQTEDHPSPSSNHQYPDYLPDEALDTIALIEKGGPFPYRKDGSTFQNRERQLPKHPRGYYREFTVETPGSDDRGARRIVTGGDPVETYCYTDDHYRSFRCFKAQP